MYNLQLIAEQQEMRDTVRAFVAQEIRPVALHPDRLQPEEVYFSEELLMQKYVHASLVFVHSRTSNSTSKLRIAEALSRYERP